MNRNKEACHCNNVTYGRIADAIASGADTVQQVMEITGAGKGCGKCREFLAYLIRDIQESLQDSEPAGKAAGDRNLTGGTP